MIELHNITHSYGSKPVLRGITAEIGEGLTYVTGPNGAGKTTLLKIVSCIYKPTGGRIKVDGVDVWNVEERSAIEIRRRIIYVHENPVALRGTVLDNLLYGFRIRGLDNEEAIRERINPVAEMLGIKSLYHVKANTLSAGQLHKVALARALSLNPKYLVLDEPFAHLDEEGVRKLRKLLNATLAEERDKAVIIATHFGELMREDNARILKIVDGKLL